MAYPTGVDFKHTSLLMGAQPINESSTTQKHPLGLVVTAKDTTYGVGEFVYCVGVASTAAGDLCCYDSKNGDTARAVHLGATSTGSCGVAMSANVAGQYGWYQISGAGPVLSGTVAADAPIYLTSTAGSVDDAVVAGDRVQGMTSRSASSGGYTTVQMDRPNIQTESGTASIATLQSDVTAVTATANAAATKASILVTTLTAAAEIGGANTIEVEGQIEDLAGLDAATAREVVVTSLAVTADEGDLSIGAGANPGTLIKAVNPATGENVAWITTTAAGHFRFIVTNTAAETNVVTVTTNGALPAVLKLTFA